jgi:hypothetical protein
MSPFELLNVPLLLRLLKPRNWIKLDWQTGARLLDELWPNLGDGGGQAAVERGRRVGPVQLVEVDPITAIPLVPRGRSSIRSGALIQS